MVDVSGAGQPDKQSWRAELRARRAAVTVGTREVESAALATALGELAVSLSAAAPEPPWMAGYVPVRDEPGSLAMLDALHAGGARVLLPLAGPPGPLDWAQYTGTTHLRRGRYGLLEPTSGALSPAAIGWAQVILVPALAVDVRGVRLGQGAGYYDRTLPAADRRARLIAVVRDEEVLPRLPVESHDRRMGWVLTPNGGLRRLTETTAITAVEIDTAGPGWHSGS